MFGKLFRRGRTSGPRQRPAAPRKAKPTCRPQLEQLELRLAPAAQAGISDGVLQVYGGGPGGPITLDHTGSTTLVAGERFSDSSFTRVQINTSSEDSTVDLFGSVRPVSVLGGGGHNRVILGSPTSGLHNLFVPVDIQDANGPAGPLGNTDLIADDCHCSTGLTYVFDYSGAFGTITINGAPWYKYNLITTTSVRLISSLHSDTVNVRRAYPGIPLTLDNCGGDDNILLGNPADGAQRIQAPVHVQDFPGATSELTVDDRGNTLDQPAVAHSVTGTTGTIVGLAPVPITYVTATVPHVYLLSGQGHDVFNVESTAPGVSLTVNTNLGVADVVNVSPTAQDLSTTLGGPLTVSGGAGGADLNVYDQLDATPAEVYVLAAASLTSVAAPINFAMVRSLTLAGGSGAGDQYIVNGTGAVVSTTITGGNGMNVFDIEATTHSLLVNGGTGGDCFRFSPVAQRLANVTGPVTLNEHAGDIIEFFDTSNPTVETYLFNPVSSHLALVTDAPLFNCNWNGLGTVYLETNLFPGSDTSSAPPAVHVNDPAPC
jgi:hypothetical protein